MKEPTMKYRARGHYKPTKRDAWVTTVWRATKKEAELDVKMHAGPYYYSKAWVVGKKKVSLKHSW